MGEPAPRERQAVRAAGAPVSSARRATGGPHRRLPPLPVGQDVAGGPVAEADEEGAESFVPKQLLRLPGQRTYS